MGRELEFKYRTTPEQMVQLREAYPGLHAITMETTYFDFPGRPLKQIRWTLRRRMENGVSVCTLKIPLPDGSRGEWEVCAPDILSALPLLAAAGAPAIPAAGTPEAICGARFTRLAGDIFYEGTHLELALDQGILLGGGKELSLCETEIELKEGSDEAARRFAAQLAADFSLSPEPLSKFRRAQLLAE